MGVVVHGIVDADSVPALSEAALGVAAGRPVRCVVSEDLAGLVTDGPDSEVPPSRANLLAHTRLLEAVAEQTTVLPMRFGVVVHDDAALRRDYLAARQEELRRSLARLRGFVELRLRASYVEDEVVRVVLEGDRKAARLRGRPGMQAKVELGERISAGIDARRERDAQVALDALAPRAADVAVTPVVGGLDVLVASFLVASDRHAAFDTAVDELAGRLAPVATVELVGPMPPFSFTGGGGLTWD
ncbi:MAG: GvpL/GvpF family gas vesicle protein [Actinomycetota bacterium]|nr:GvpL/GvpF family gas vesicle protein [Actinomycetota bacterium]